MSGFLNGIFSGEIVYYLHRGVLGAVGLLLGYALFRQGKKTAFLAAGVSSLFLPFLSLFFTFGFYCWTFFRLVSAGDQAAGPVIASEPAGGGSPEQQLREAIESPDHEAVHQLLADGVDVNTIFDQGLSPLQAAAGRFDSRLVKLLLDRGAKVNWRDFKDHSTLMRMAEKKPAAVAWELKSRNAGLGLLTSPAKFLAQAEEQQLATIDYLLAAGAAVNQQNFKGETALMLAARAGNAHVLERLLKAEAQINSRDNEQRTAMDQARKASSRKCIALLKQAGAVSRHPMGRSANFRAQFWEKGAWDEFDDLNDIIAWKKRTEKIYRILIIGMIGITLASFVMIFGALPTFIPLCFLVALVSLAFITRHLLLLFPAIPWLLTNRRRDQDEVEKKEEKTLSEAIVGAEQQNLDYISNLLKLGARELRRVRQSEAVRKSEAAQKNIRSRLWSAVLALGLFLLFCLWAGEALLLDRDQPFILAPAENLLAGWMGIEPEYGPEADSVRFNAIKKFLLALLYLPLAWICLGILNGFKRIEWQLRRNRLVNIQQEMDTRASDLARLVEATDEGFVPPSGDYGLYLRAFQTTDKLHVNGIDLETTLAYSLRDMLPIVALGQPGEHLGAGRIETTDEHWQEEILRLMDNARLILIVPSHRPGTVWEILTLREEQYLSKTIFIMPPDRAEIKLEGLPYSALWALAVAELRKHGVKLPEHFKNGLLFRLLTDGTLASHAPFGIEELVRSKLDLTLGGDDANGDDDDGDGDGDGGEGGDGGDGGA
jgi:hypothetical protein